MQSYLICNETQTAYALVVRLVEQTHVFPFHLHINNLDYLTYYYNYQLHLVIMYICNYVNILFFNQAASCTG